MPACMDQPVSQIEHFRHASKSKKEEEEEEEMVLVLVPLPDLMHEQSDAASTMYVRIPSSRHNPTGMCPLWLLDQ